MAVMRGEWQYEALISWAEEMDKRIHEMDSPLPNKPDRKLVDGLCVGIYLHELCPEAYMVI